MKSAWLIGLLVLLVAGASAHGGLVPITPTAAGGLKLTGFSWDADSYDLVLTERVFGSPATSNGGFDYDGDDPIVWIHKEVLNDTDFGWGAYDIQILMPQYFDVTAVKTPNQYTATPGVNVWSATYDATTFDAGLNKYQTMVRFVGDPGVFVPVGSWGDFGVQIQFSGSVQFCAVQTPIAPEPISLMLLASGALLWMRKRM